MSDAFDIDRLEKEIAEYEAEIRRFEDEDNQVAVCAVRRWKESLERKIDVIRRENLA